MTFGDHSSPQRPCPSTSSRGHISHAINTPISPSIISQSSRSLEIPSMALQLRCIHLYPSLKPIITTPRTNTNNKLHRSKQLVVSSSSSSSSSSSANATVPSQWDSWKPEKGAAAPSLSDILWPSAGAFAAMALLGKIDQLLAPRGVSATIAPLGAVCAVLFATPSSPGARKYNMFMAQIGCAAIGVLAFAVFGPGWLARSVGLSAAIGFMIWTRSIHPPAASLPLLFIDAVKLQKLNFWYAVFPGAASCVLLCLIQEMVCYLKDNFKF